MKWLADSVARIKAYKNDGYAGLLTNHFKFACFKLFTHMESVFGMLAHGNVPDGLRISTSIPIPKSCKANLTDSKNYTGITLSSIFGKICDLIVLARYNDKLASCDTQFGFKAKRSTGMCL